MTESSLTKRAQAQRTALGLTDHPTRDVDTVTGKPRLSIDASGLTGRSGAGVPTEGILWTKAELRSIHGGPSAPLVEKDPEDDNGA